MNDNNLIARYVYAVTRRLPAAKREEVGKELNASINDMLEGRLNGAEASERDVRAVLLELGSPAEMAAKYVDTRDTALIGEPQFSAYKLVLKIVLGAVALGLTIAMLVSVLANPQADIFKQIWEWVVGLFSGALQAFAWVTIIFAILYRLGTPLDFGTDNLDDLPEVPTRQELIPRAEPIIGLIFSVLFAVLFFLLPQINIPIFGFTSKYVPFFTPQVLVEARYFILAAFAAGVVQDSLQLLEGRYTVPVLLASLVSNVTDGLLAFALLSKANLINPNLTEALIRRTGNVVFARFLEDLPPYFSWILAFIIFALAVESVTLIVKTFRARK